MSDTKFTPGPWAISQNDPYIFGREQGNGLEPLGFLYGPAFGDRSEYGQRSMANAHLIAAAPDLYEALNCAVIKLARYREVHEVDGSYIGALAVEFDAALQAARAVLAKATGEQS